MLDYTYIRPLDPAAAEAELTEAMHVQAAPVWVDMEYTYDAPPVRLVRASEVAELRAKLDAATQRAEAAEARALEEEAISYDIAAKAALDAQNWREELTVIRQRLDAAEAKLDAARADLDLTCGYLDAVTNGLSVRELAQLADVAAEVRQRWGLEQ